MEMHVLYIGNMSRVMEIILKNSRDSGLDGETIEEQLKNVQTSIKLRDEQLQMSDSCTIVLSQQAGSRTGQRTKTVFLMSSPEAKQDWVMDFRAVKLAQGTVSW